MIRTDPCTRRGRRHPGASPWCRTAPLVAAVCGLTVLGAASAVRAAPSGTGGAGGRGPAGESEAPETSTEEVPPPKKARPRFIRKLRPEDAPGADGVWKPRTLALVPAIGYNIDDGLGLGIFGDVRWNPRPGEARRHRANFGINAKIWLKPQQVGWTGLFGLSLYPQPSGETEITAAVSTFGRFWDWYYGIGNDTVRDRTAPLPNPRIRDSWHRFGHFRVRADVHAFQRFAGPLDFFVGAAFSWNRILAREGTLLDRDYDSLDAADGGFTVALDGGPRLDTRDNRLDPVRGGLIVGIGQLNLGPERPWARIALDVRGYQGIAQDRVVFAGQALLLAGIGPVPFYELGVVPGFALFERAMTGVYGLRALVRGRLRAPLGAEFRGEVRFRPPGFMVLEFLQLRLEPIAFVEAVRVDDPPELGKGWFLNPALGGGVRLYFNEVTVTRLDVGTSPERILTPDGELTTWTFGIYATTGHTF